jgi:hypothetical protein
MYSSSLTYRLLAPQRFISLLTVVLSFFVSIALAQNNSAITITAKHKTIELKELTIISNVMQLKNNGAIPATVSLDATMPSGWRIMNNKIQYTIAPKDSIFIPFRVIPKGPLKGNTEYLIDVIVYNQNRTRLTSVGFSALVIKKTDWSLHVEPSNKIYFLNNSRSTDFKVRYSNNGDDDEMVLSSFKQPDKSVSVMDSAGNRLENYKDIFNLRARLDTQITFHVSFTERKNNVRRIDLDNHLPNNTQEEEKRFLLFLQSTEAGRKQDANTFRKNEKIEFIKLSNQKKVNPFSSDGLPLIMETNVFNIMGEQPVMFTNLRGNTLLANNANLFYYSQNSYSSYFTTPDYLRSVSYYVGYFHEKGDIQIGDMSGSNTVGFQSFGRGVKGSYNITSKHNVGGFLLKSPRLMDDKGIISYGSNYRFNFNRSNFAAFQVSRSENQFSGSSCNFFTGSTRITFMKTQGITLGGGTSLRNRDIPGLKRNGSYVNVNYSGLFLNNRLTSELRLSNLSRSFGESGSGRFYTYHQTGFILNPKVSLILINNYTTMNAVANSNFTFFNNQFFVNLKQKNGVLIPSVFYNTQSNFGLRRHYRGVGFDYNFFKMLTNLKVSTSLRLGYNKLIDHPDVPNFFSSQSSILAQYKTVSLNARYFYGPTIIRNADDIRGMVKYPQTFFASFQHQLVFPKEYFVLHNNLNYSYYNQFYSHTFGYFPELYLFTGNGWRFRTGVGFSVNVSNPRKALELQNPGQVPTDPDGKTNVLTTNINVQFGLRKEFGIPLPYKMTKRRYVTVNYRCFIDVNGNRIKDKTEPELENIVIRTGDEEVMSNTFGSAELENMPAGKYHFSILNLSDNQSYFPVIPDSVLLDRNKEVAIPFVKGSKITGQIYLQRERFAVDADVVLDLSRIMVTAKDTAGNVFRTITRYDGTFELYVPNTRYVITLDAGVWGNQFTILNNHLELDLNPRSDNTFISFQVAERQRKIEIKKF